ncbi:uncharacterized protein NFIA_099430 [Aspergillus fischeri NRRL 181]|uniref:Uncharacterized protein n=1 Tax=Neosartorya fischeri (strain ATCC 1020 / DSM 3700 / CBS 544.65 / FGSC A1164 / JCM 1740 / NRRL 181 / WB 181) TaxID=331117 RepID=A1DBR8_NEOFI|nr:uncharacterized protein NFIA_099430 [Aspergillus fischeri NRRL 181]EAW20308.1 hypothetical protein NFIA_099430 [Aspergillus fischeri NRRL 181]
MGCLTAVMLPHAEPAGILSIISVKGNRARGDGFLSWQISTHLWASDEEFLVVTLRRLKGPYGACLRARVCVGAVRGVFASVAKLSDEGG